MNTEEFIKRSIERHGNKYDYSKSIYVNPKTDIIVTCPKHGDFNTRPYNHMGGSGCRKCADEANSFKYRKTRDEFIEDARKVHGDKYDYSKVDYVNWKTKVTVICPIHGEFEISPNSHVSGKKGCRLCGIEKRSNEKRYTTDDFIKRAREVHGDVYDYSQVEYKDTGTNVLIKCTKCGFTFHQTPENHLQGKGCPHCAKQLSRAENEIYNEMVNCLGEKNVLRRDRNLLNNLEVDVFIPLLNLGIEYNGLRWHSEQFKADRYYHLNKLNECNKKGVNLIQIFEDEWNLKRDLVLKKIKHIAGVEAKLPKIYARKCFVEEIDKKNAEIFLNKNHIQGFVNSTIYLGCFHDNELIAVMSLTKYGNDFWELSRFASDNDYICCGVASKMFSYFTKKYYPKEVKSFADRRWTISSENNLYTKLGFKIDKVLYPDYKYAIKGMRIHKFNFRKQVLHKKYGFPLSMTELEMTKQLGYYRVWDCGLFKYVWKNPKAEIKTDEGLS